jgi:pimeloyl-ACP methyl ester carboxylesterase
MASELAELVDRGSINGPLVLVAASIGGYAARVFASEYPDRVAALVLIDASHENQEHTIPAFARFVPLLSSLGVFRIARISFGLPPELIAPATREFAQATRFRAAAQRTAAHEIISAPTSAAQVAATRRTLTVPVFVVTAGQGAGAEWRDLQRDLLALSQHSCQIVATRSGHAIAVAEPEVVIRAIRTAVQTIRQDRSAGPQCELAAEDAAPPAAGTIRNTAQPLPN